MDGKYIRQKVLGKGSFGKAFLVLNTEANELCAVKQMETSQMPPKERNEAMREALLLKKMDHPNIVRFQEVFVTRKGRLCIVMDYADGGDVHLAIKKREGQLMPERQILEWFVQICFALKHVHARKVLHRDLKTQNVFLMLTGQIKLGDFGIAKVLDATKDYAKTMVGTPYYLSPEIIEDRPYSFKSDIWSLGVVLYEMATLKHPFDADSLVILATKILKDNAPEPSDAYSEDLRALARCMLCKDARSRPAVSEILARPILQEVAHSTNATFSLGLDLPVLGPAEAVATPAESAQPRAAPSPAAAPATQVPEDSVLIGTVQRLPAAAEESAPPVKGDDKDGGDKDRGGEDEYEEEFEEYEEEYEDYSGSEDGEKPPKSELAQSVAQLKIGVGEGQQDSKLATVAEANTSAAAPQPTVPRPVDVSATGSGTRIGAKAESLRSYLCGQLPREQFDKAYAIVRGNSDEASADALKQRVADVIGEEKAPDLFSLFQLLCFLEDVAASGQGGASS